MSQKSSVDFIDYQRSTWNLFYYEFLTLNVIKRTDKGQYYITWCPLIGKLLYFVAVVNSSIKAVFLLGLLKGIFLPGSLDDDTVVSVYDWILCCMELVVCGSCWCFRYPLFEVFYQIWYIEERVYERLGRPKEMAARINHELKTIVGINMSYYFVFNRTILLIGVAGAAFQFYSDSKFCLYTYALLEEDNWWLRIIFGLHEVAFVYQCWTYYASTFVLCSINATCYSEILNELTRALTSLAEDDEEEEFDNKWSRTEFRENIPISNIISLDRKASAPGHSRKNSNTFSRNYAEVPDSKENPLGYEDNILSAGSVHSNSSGNSITHRLRNRNKALPIEKIAHGTSYDIYSLITDYKHLMMSSWFFNDWVANKVAGQNIVGYAQMVSDIYMVFHILKRSGSSFGDVFYFLLDAIMGMYMTFRMIKTMANVYTSSEEFHRALANYLSHCKDNTTRNYLLKIRNTTKMITFKIGVVDMRPGTVLSAMEALLSYFLCAAMW